MTNKTAVYDVEFKALPDLGEVKGRFTALVAAFGNVDLQGDRVMPGAFKNTIATWQASGYPVPLIFSHDWSDPFAHLGVIDSMTETMKGLEVSGNIDLTNPYAAQVYKLLKERRIREWSFGYEIVKEQTAPDHANNLIELNILEAGPTLKGANSATETLAIKSALEPFIETKAGATHSSATLSQLQTMHDTLASMGVKCAVSEASAPKADDPAGAEVVTPEAKTEEPEGAKVEEPKDDWLLHVRAELEAAALKL